MALPLHPAVTMATAPRNLIDLKANGEVSRMRNHKGNMPSLPQTKYCSLCPAKFTRTTHLNRHLRSHTNERLHRCNTCNAEFTRSDLLTRHKRTCGDSANANRSRRKSCQACAESKVKCNLQYPCSKCTSRGKDCVFINDPEASRNKRNAKKAQRSASPKSTSDDNTALSALGASSPPPFSNPTSPLSTISTVTSPADLENPFPLLHHSSASISSGSSNSSPRTDLFDARQDIPHTYDVDLDTLSLDTHLNRLFTTPTLESFVESSTCSPHANELAWLDGGGNAFYPQYHDGYGYATSGDQFPGSAIEYASHASTANGTIPTLGLPPSSPSTNLGAMPRLVDQHVVDPTAAELEHYLYAFVSEFLTQVPVIHAASWNFEDKPYYLIRIMQACGALLVKTGSASSFISETLSSLQDSLVYELAKNPSDSTENLNLIIAIVLLQVIGQFHQKPEHRAPSSALQGMTVTLVRRMGLLDQVRAWVPPDLGDPHSLEMIWRDWVHYETIKRLLFLSYLHDCNHCVYFSVPPSYQAQEFNFSLPCDDALWRAESPSAWLNVLQMPSSLSYGAGSCATRLTGVGMPHAFSMLSMPLETRIHGATPPLNPFAQYILIHSILRDLYTSQLDVGDNAAIPAAAGGATLADGSAVTVFDLNPNQHPRLGRSHGAAESVTEDQVLITQRALQNWLQIWLSNPETMHLTGQPDANGVVKQDPPYLNDALPYYWLAQATVYAIQASSFHLAPAGNSLGTAYRGIAKLFEGDTSFEARFRVVQVWMERIKAFLRDGTQQMAVLWKDLMQLRERVTHEDREARTRAVNERMNDFRSSGGFMPMFPLEGLMGMYS